MPHPAPSVRAPDGLDDFWAQPAEAVTARLDSGPEGLTSAQADALLRRTGANRLQVGAEATWWRLLGRQFLSPIEIILVVATVLSGILGDWTDATIILIILLLSGLLGFVQERRAGTAIRALLASVEAPCTASRDGAAATLPLSAIVPGDLVHLRAGDVIPGDGLVLSATGLTLDQSALTGETFPVEKRPGPVPADAPVAERDNTVFLGTHVASGTGTVLVVRTGARTQLAEIAATLDRKPPQTGFEKGMTRFGLLLTRAMVVLVIVIFVVNLLLQRPPVDSALFSLALAIGLTPQLLPAIVAISLAEGARAMARARVIVRRMDAIEDVGSMDVLCSDKTGTMTSGRITLDGALTITGDPAPEVAALAALNAGLQTGWSNPIDEAILAAHPAPSRARVLGELPYDFLRRRQSVLVEPAPGARPLLITKGAVDAVLDVCTQAAAPAGTVPLAQARAEVQAIFAALSAQGFRVLALATREMPAAHEPAVADESGMRLAGLLTFADPVKPDAATTVAQLVAAGVSVRIVTGDNRHVAAHVAGQVGVDASRLVTGAEVDAVGDAALAKTVHGVQVFCEMNPVQKERVIRAFRRGGHVVGYLGDGINDAPPLHAADVGITVDQAVPVAKQSADIVLLEKQLDVLREGIRQGRRTFANTMKYIFVTTSASFGNMLSMAVAAAILPFLPLLAGQILLVNLLSDVPGMTIATDAVDDEQLRRPQQWDVRLIRTYMIVFGALSSVFDLLTFAVLRWGFGALAPEFRSAWFVGSILTEVGVLFILRTRGAFYRSRPSAWLIAASLVVVAVTVWLPYSPIARPLELVPIPAELLAAIVLITVVYLAANEAVKRGFWAWRSRPRRPRR